MYVTEEIETWLIVTRCFSEPLSLLEYLILFLASSAPHNRSGITTTADGYWVFFFV